MVIALYVPVLNEDVFKHKGIDWEWGIVAASILVYIILTEVWKYFKRGFLRRRQLRYEEKMRQEDQERIERSRALEQTHSSTT
ncbi:predicted protein [Lichtheimia corymbifera JMRC:FSU:9682]|nr:predicted protein [Lichtheimia corymbifera JMRC:FSU:9682]